MTLLRKILIKISFYGKKNLKFSCKPYFLYNAYFCSYGKHGYFHSSINPPLLV